MEMFELRYFYAAAEFESINDASEKLHISSSAISKAISRLEDEFKIKLFEKSGRGIQITTKGRELFHQCQKFFELETETLAQLAGKNAEMELTIAGPEVFLAHYGISLSEKIQAHYPECKFRFKELESSLVSAALMDQKADIGIITNNDSKLNELHYKNIDKVSFATYIGEHHPLYISRKGVDINKLLEFDFLTPSQDVLGISNIKITNDGWRDDKFPRKVRYKDVGLKTIENLVLKGKAIAYLPEYLVRSDKLHQVRVLGCPYKCEQTIHILTKKSPSRDWLWKILK